MPMLQHADLVHLDADAFFASVEQAADRRLRGRPMAVGGRHRGIIASASYEARSLGIHTAMPTRRALQVCPDLTVVPGNFELYEEFSGNIFGLCEELTPWVERTSIDEGYLSTAGWLDSRDTEGMHRRGPAGAAVRHRQEESLNRVRALSQSIENWMKISVSTGVAANKLTSQVASKLRKPRGFVVVPRGAEAAFLEPLPVRRLPGLGPKLAAQVEAIGLRTLGDLVRAGPDTLRPLFRNMTETILDRARGIDPTPLCFERAAAKSYGQQETFAEDVGDFETATHTIFRMMDQLLPKLRAERRLARTFTLRIRYNDMEEARQSRSLEEPADIEDVFYPLVRPMLRKLWARRVHLRLIGITFSNIYDAWFQTDLFRQEQLRRRDLVWAVDELNETYGKKQKPAVQRACHLL